MTISTNEMRRAIKKLKNGKSAGEDNVMNEVLETAQPYLELAITKLMNLTLASEKYPSPWCRNNLITLYKGGGNDYHILIIIEEYQLGPVWLNYTVQYFITRF